MDTKSSRRSRAAESNTESRIPKTSTRKSVVEAEPIPKKQKTTKSTQKNEDEFDIAALVKQASSRFAELCTETNSLSQLPISDSVAKSTDSTLENAGPVNPTSRFFVPASNGMIALDSKAGDVRGCESTSVYLSKGVISSTINNPLAEVEKKVDLVDELISTTTATTSDQQKRKKVCC